MANFGLTFTYEVLKMEKKPEDMLKIIVLASKKPNQN